MKSIQWLTLVLCLLATTAASQGFQGDFILGGSVYSQTDAVFRVDRTTLNLTTLVTGITPASTSHMVWEVIMAEDNVNLYALSAHYAMAGQIVKLDPAGTILSTVYVGSASTLNHLVNMYLDQNGKLVVYDCGGSMTGPGTILEIDPATGTAATIATVPRGDSFYGSGARDIDTGDYLTFFYDMVHRVDRVTKAVTTLCNLGVRKARMSFAQDTLTGKAYAGTYGAPALFEMDLVAGTWTTLNAANMGGTYGLKFDRRVDARFNKMFCGHGAFSSTTIKNGVAEFDTTGTMTAITTWSAGTGTPMPYSLEVEGSREVQPILKVVPNGRQILLSFPGRGGLAYVCAVGISGIRPGLPLPDGRVIHLVVDRITLASLAGALDPLIPNRVGVLSKSGTATTGLDLNLLGNAVQGLPIVFQVVVLDPRATSGIAVVAEPYVIKPE